MTIFTSDTESIIEFNFAVLKFRYIIKKEKSMKNMVVQL